MKIKVEGKKKQQIYKVLKDYKKNIEDKGYDVLFIGVKGSQNYNLDYDGSDIDCICAVKPYKYGTKPISFKINMSDGNENTVTVQDIFTFTKQVNKGNNSYIEVLNSPFKISKLPDLYSDAKCNAKSHYHMMVQKYKALKHPYPSKLSVIAKYGYDPKQLHHIYRLHYLVIDATKGIDPRNVWVPDGYERDFLINLKTIPDVIFEDLEDVEKCVEIIMRDTKALIEDEKYYDIFQKQIDNKISDEIVIEFLKELDNKTQLVKDAELVSKVYKLLNNEQYLDKSHKSLLKELHSVYGIDMRKVEVQEQLKSQNLPTENYYNLNEVYSEFLNLLALNTDLETHIKKIKEKRGNLGYDEIRLLVNKHQFRYLDIELYEKTINSTEFKDFANKYSEILKGTPGFYQKYITSKNIWVWKFVFSEGIIIPNRVNGNIRNLQIRGIKEDRSKYFNFSSSKKTGEFYRYATKAHQGISMFSYSIESKLKAQELIITEGFFKGFTTYYASLFDRLDKLNKLLQSQDIEPITDYDVLALPGLSASIHDIDFSKYKRVIFAFDRDCHLGNNNQAKNQYKKMVEKVMNKCNKMVIFDEYTPDFKIDDDILKSYK